MRGDQIYFFDRVVGLREGSYPGPVKLTGNSPHAVEAQPQRIYRASTHPSCKPSRVWTRTLIQTSPSNSCCASLRISTRVPRGRMNLTGEVMLGRSRILSS